MTTQPSRSPLVALIVGAAVPALLWGCLCVGLVLYVPRYKKIFADFALVLPGATVAVIAVSDWIANYWYVLLLSLPFLFAPDVLIILLLWRRGSSVLGRLWAGLMIVLPLLAAAVVVIALYLPLTKLYEGLSK
jgi:type II secretory pathway component PulF